MMVIFGGINFRQVDAATRAPLDTSRGDMQCVELLLDAGARPDAKDVAGKTAIHYATMIRSNAWSHEVAVKLVKEYGADPDMINRHNSTPFHTGA